MEKEITEEEEYDILEAAHPFTLVFGDDRKIVMSLLKSIGGSEWIESGHFLLHKDDTDSENPLIDVFELKYILKIGKISKKLREKLGIKFEVKE